MSSKGIILKRESINNVDIGISIFFMLCVYMYLYNMYIFLMDDPWRLK